MEDSFRGLSFDIDALDRPGYLFYPEVDVMDYQPVSGAKLGGIDLLSPADGSQVQLLGPRQREYVAMSMEGRMACMPLKNVRDWLVAERDDTHAVTLAFKCEVPAKKRVRVIIAERPDFSHGISVRVSSYTPDRLELRNLKIATTYYWKVQAEAKQGVFESAVYSFTTADQAPRLMKVGGMRNFRDLGGRKGLWGKRVRQGLVYRTCGLNSNAKAVYEEPETVLQNHPDLKATYEAYQMAAGRLEEAIARHEEKKVVSWSMGKDWRVFVPDQKLTEEECYHFISADETLESFKGASGRVVTMDSRSRVVIGDPEEMRPGFLVNTLVAEEDGVVLLNCIGDWHWYLAVNGTLVCDCSKDGNCHPVISKDNIQEIPVKAGRNVLTVMVKSGSSGFGWYCRPQTDYHTHEDVLRVRLAEVKRKASRSLQILKERVPGVDLLDESMTDYMTKTLGIKTDVDLRAPVECFGMTGSPLGAGVEWTMHEVIPYEYMERPRSLKAVKEIFPLFLDKSKYPIDFHCIGGKDRTGSIAFVLNALLGVELNELYLDWEVTAFDFNDLDTNHKEMFSRLMVVFNDLPGSCIREKVEFYMMSLGFTQEDFAKFRSWMLE